MQFGKKIEQYGSIQEKIARLAIRQYITEVDPLFFVCFLLFVCCLCCLIDTHQLVVIESGLHDQRHPGPRRRGVPPRVRHRQSLLIGTRTRICPQPANSPHCPFPFTSHSSSSLDSVYIIHMSCRVRMLRRRRGRAPTRRFKSTVAWATSAAPASSAFFATSYDSPPPPDRFSSSFELYQSTVQ